MKQNKTGILTLAVMILSIGLICGAQVVKAEDGDIVSISLKDANENGKIDEVHITVSYTGTATTVDPDPTSTDLTVIDLVTETINKFAVTDTGTMASVDITSMEFVSGDGTIAIFKLNLDEASVSVDTSGTALDVVYTPTSSDPASASDLKITDGLTSPKLVYVKLIEKSFTEEDGAAPVMISAIYKDIDPEDETVDSIDVTYSEDIGDSTFLESEWSLPTNLHYLIIDSVLISPTSTTDVRIAIDPDSSVNINDTTINDTKVGYIATINAGSAVVNGGITDGVNYAEDQELSVSTEEDEDEDENEDDIEIPSYGYEKSTQPNLNSGVILYKVLNDPRVYVIKNKKKHWIHTPKEFNDNGYSWGKVKIVSAEVLEEYSDAEDSATELLRAVGSHKVYKINNGKRSWIKTAGEFNAAGYKWKDIKDVSPEDLASYQNEVSSELLRATGSYKVYIIENGKKRWIKTVREFNAAGHKWENVEEVAVQDLDDYPNLD